MFLAFIAIYCFTKHKWMRGCVFYRFVFGFFNFNSYNNNINNPGANNKTFILIPTARLIKYKF